MTNAPTDHHDLSPEDAADLERYLELARELRRIPGRPTVIDRLGLTDNRARQIIDLARNIIDPRTPPVTGRTGGGRHLAPAGDRPLPVGPPAGAPTPADQHQPATHVELHTTPDGADTSSPSTQPVAPDGDYPPTWRHATTPPASHHQRHPSRPVRFSLLLAGLAAFSFAAGHVAARIPATNGPRQQAVELITTWASPLGWAAAIAAAIVATGTAVTSVVALILRVHAAHQHRHTTTRQDTPAGAKGFYVGAVMSLAVSFDTSWRFFEHKLHIAHLWERGVMFAVLEIALIACGYGMRANVHRSGHPGAPRMFAWLLCGLSAYMAWQLSGVAEGLARIALGPALGLGMLHLALGIEIRAGAHARLTTWARIGRELRERLLSRLGLADDERDALARTRDRAWLRAARLVVGKVVPFRSIRIARALRISNIAHDPADRARMLAVLAVLRHADQLGRLDMPSPWHPYKPVPAATSQGDSAQPQGDDHGADRG